LTQRRLYLALAALLPWSVDIPLFGGIHLLFPAEVIIGILAIMILSDILQQKITIPHWTQLTTPNKIGGGLITAYLLWGWITAIGSSLPWISLKYMVVNSAHLLVFLLPPLLWPDMWKKCLQWMAISTYGLVVYTLFRHGYFFHFRDDQANLAPMPFLDDHTIYAAYLTLFIFISAIQSQAKWIVPILGIGLLFSTCRGAWISIVTALSVCSILWIWYRNTYFFVGLTVLFVVFLWFFEPKIQKTVTQKISSDVSLAERINRYQCAKRMTKVHPIMGFGPGTYAFQYLAFQEPGEMTRISQKEVLLTRDPSNYGHGGGAHSEYLQASSEMGWPGLILLLTVVGLPLFCFRPQKKYHWWLIAAWYSFWAHAILNNFLHDPRVSALVWGTFGWITRDVLPPLTSKENH
jgi:putative inorganic carbon (hco3(-)) transporter